MRYTRLANACDRFMIKLFLPAVVLVGLACGCGATKARVATEQLLASDAVDQAVSRIDFTPFDGESVYLDVKYIAPATTRTGRQVGYVDENYVISSLRQQIIASGGLLQDSAEKADFILEPRVGTLGTDSREIVYGLPASNALSTVANAASALSTTPPLPAIPEISLARRDDQSAAAKIACFAYHRESRQPVWQSGLAIARSDAKDTYIFGAGPFQRGTIYKGVKFAGLNDRRAPATLMASERERVRPGETRVFVTPSDLTPDPVEVSEVQTAGHEEPAKDEAS